MTTWTAKDYQNGLARASDIPRQQPHPTLLKYAGEYMTRPTVTALEQKARRMAGTLRTLADGEWHELCRADGPDHAIVKHGLVEVERLRRNLNCRITEDGLRIHREVEGLPLVTPEPVKPKRRRRPRKPKLNEGQEAAAWYHEWNLLICLG